MFQFRLIRRAPGCIGMLLVLGLSCMSGSNSHAQLSLFTSATQVDVSNNVQRLVFTKGGDGRFRLQTYVRHGAVWETLFDAQRPLIEGPAFNHEPVSFTVLEDSATRKLIQFQGTTVSPQDVWDIAVEARADSDLIYFQLASHFTSNVALTTPQPTVALWMNQTTPTVQVDQGPPSPTGNAYNVPFNFGFPSAYFWNNQREAAVFFDMGPMSWMSSQGLWRFFDVQIRSLTQGSQTGLGMHPRKRSGNTLRSGEMLTTFFLYSAWREAQPTKFEALDTLIRKFAPRHPRSSSFPTNTLQGGAVSWLQFAQKLLADMRVLNTTYAELSTIWDDTPLYLVDIGTRMIVHPDRIVANASDAQNAWNFATVNGHLAPAVLYSRLFPADTAAGEFARLKKDALPRFYDSVARMLVSGTRQPVKVFPAELSWQSLLYYQYVLATYECLPPDQFNPAIGGRLLMGLEGLIRFARDVNYLFPTYFNPITRQPLDFAENPGLGKVREPWSVGSYAYVLMRAFELTRDFSYRDEARTALDYFLDQMSYSVTNSYYSATYREPMDMPIMELFGNGYGAIAAWKLYEDGGDARYRQVARDFLNTLLRQTFWHEENWNAISGELHNAGLFYPFVGANTATPMETVEANLCIAWLLKRDLTSPIYSLLLTLSNLNRINSFSFYPATFSSTVRALNPTLRQDIGQYFPIEELYCLEAPGGSTASNGTAEYMAANALWNYWLYEALGQSNDNSILVLNPDAIDHVHEGLTGALRTLIVFNPNDDARLFTLSLANLPPGNYQLRRYNMQNQPVHTFTYTQAQLVSGQSMTLNAREFARLEYESTDGSLGATIAGNRAARNQVSYAYQLLQQYGRDRGVDALAQALKTEFQQAMQAYTQGNNALANVLATDIIHKLGHQNAAADAEWSIYD